MAFFLSPIGNSSQIDANGDPLVGGKIATYLAGSTTATATYTSNTGATQQANPIILNSLGLPASPIWLAEGVSYKFVISDAGDAVLQTIDNIEGVNDAATSASEWVASGYVPTYLSATTFSVPGDQTDTLLVGRSLRTTNTAGTIYSRITVSSFGAAITTVTVINDSGVLDSGLSAVSYGLQSPSNPSGPNSAAVRTAMGTTVPRGHISGLVPSTAGGSATITVSAGQAVDSTHVELLALASAIGKTTSAWAVGTAAGGLDTGAIANTTKYYLWLIKRVDTGVVDVLISLSSSAPTMPANYTLKRLIGFGLTDGSAQWVSFTAVESPGGGIDWAWTVPKVDISTATLTTSRVLSTLSVPVTTVKASMKLFSSNAANAEVNVMCPDETDAAPSAAAGYVFVLAAGVGAAATLFVQTNASGQVGSRSTAANTTLTGVTTGFTWSRR